MHLGIKKAVRVIGERDALIKDLAQSLDTMYTLLSRINAKKYNGTAHYKWGWNFNVSPGELQIYIEKKVGIWKVRDVVLRDISDKREIEEKILKQDTRLFEALKEANAWVSANLESFKKTTSAFKDNLAECSQGMEEAQKFLG